MSAFVLENQAARVAMLRKYEILDSLPEPVFDDLVNLAAQVCGTPIALINLIDGNRQWFKAKVGIDIEQMPCDMGFCPECVSLKQPLIIADTFVLEDYLASPIVIDGKEVRFYAGIPLFAEGGIIIGTVCVVDFQPRQLTAAQVDSLTAIARLVMNQLNLRLGVTELVNLKEQYEATQTALTSSECTLSSFFDSAPMMMGIVEVEEDDIVYLSVNKAAGAFFNRKPKQMSKVRASELGLSPQELQLWLHHYRYTQQTGQPVSFEYIHHTTSGEKCYFKATVTSIGSCCYATGRCAYIIEDITAHQIADLKLQWKEALLSSMADVSPLAFYVVDNRSDEILYFNPRFCEIWQIEHLREDMANRQLGHGDVMANCTNLVTNLAAFSRCCQPQNNPNNTTGQEQEILFRDGRIIRQFATQISDRDGQYLGDLYIFEDITARKQHEQKIREQAALLDITTDAIILRDLSNRILLWNSSAEKIYGWNSHEVYGKNATDIFFRSPKAELADIYNQVIREGAWQGELRKITKSGQEIIVTSRWTLILDEHFQPKSILTVETDITNTKELEKQFLRAQRMESIGTLASGIAHDLNNVLSPILMSAQVLQMKAKESESKSILKVIETNAKRGASLVKQVLSFARGMEGDRNVLFLKHIILETQQIIEQTFPKNIKIHTDIKPDLWNISGDHTQIHQVLINLCLNARDAMGDPGYLEIRAENITIDENYARMNLEARVGSYVEISISDNGSGIPAELIDRIFEPFFTTKEFGKGTGLGLSTVQGIVKGHGGFICVSSQVGIGTTFKVYLPALEIALPLPNECQKIPTGQGEWILVVDDEAAIREITHTSLETNNYQAIIASDGIEAIALYAQHKDKLRAAIVDMMMPNMDGNNTIQTLRKMNPFLPIIAVSGLVSGSQFLHQNNESNSIQFLPKPYTTSELLKTLHLAIHCA